MAFWANLNLPPSLNLLLLNLLKTPHPTSVPPPALGPPPSSTLDPDELACCLTKGQLDALASSPQVLEALKDQSTRAAVTRALAAADSSSSSSESFSPLAQKRPARRSIIEPPFPREVPSRESPGSRGRGAI